MNEHPDESKLRRETRVPVLLTITSVAAHLDMSRTHIMRLEAAGRFPAHVKVVGNRRHYREQDVVNWYHERLAEQGARRAMDEAVNREQ